MNTSSTTTDDILPEGDSVAVKLCFLGSFRVLKNGLPVNLAHRPKGQAVLVMLAVRPGYQAPRDAVLGTVWPEHDEALSRQSLNSLSYSLRRALSDAIGGMAPLLTDQGYYRINVRAGISLDVAEFDRLETLVQRADLRGDAAGAARHAAEAIGVYKGDLCAGPDVNSLVERERLRALYLGLLVRLATHHYSLGDYRRSLEYASLLLAHDPCSEEAHRLAIRCYVRLGQRIQALRQYRLCEHILREEFVATPESATRELYDLVRLDLPLTA